MKKILPLMLCAVSLALVPWVVLAGGSNGGGGVIAERQRYRWTAAESTTSSESFVELVPLSNVTVTGRGGMTATFSGRFSGGPVDLRIREREVMRPGPARFDPGTGKSSFSYTFVTDGSRVATCHYMKVQWRSPTGVPVILHRGDVVVTYNHDNTSGGREFGCL